MKAALEPKRVTKAVFALVSAALLVGLAQRAGGTNWAAGLGAALGIGFWLWSARRSYREQAPPPAAKLVVDQFGPASAEERPRSSYRRIRVFNAGGRPLNQVEVMLVACEPTPAWFQPFRLQRMQGGPHPFRLLPRGEVYIDLIALPHGHFEFVLVPDSAREGGIPNGVPIQPTELTVRVTADELSAASFVFEALRTPSGALVVRAKTEDQRAD